MSSGGGSSNAGQGYRYAAQNVMAAASYNIGLVNVNLNRNLNDLATAIPRTLSTQRAQASGTGLSIGSKSFQSLYNESLDGFARKAGHMREDAEYQRRKIWFEAQSQAYSLQLQGMQADEQARASRPNPMNTIMGAFQSIGRLF